MATQPTDRELIEIRRRAYETQKERMQFKRPTGAQPAAQPVAKARRKLPKLSSIKKLAPKARQLKAKFPKAIQKPALQPITPKLKRFKRLNRQQALFIAGGGLFMVTSLVMLFGHNTTKPGSGPGKTGSTDKGSNTSKVLGENTTAAKPEFPTIAPNGKVPAAMKYDTMHKVATYADTLNGAPITVSQQSLPVEFREDPDTKVKALAKSFNATEVVGEVTPNAYIGTSVKGPQTVIFYKDESLVFIYGDQKLDKPALAKYITSLK